MNAKPSNRYDSIDLIRVICAFGILMMHMQANGHFELGNIFPRVVVFFTNFVFLFMLISSFGLCCGYYERIINSKINLTDFYKKRFAKVLPFFTVLVLIDNIMSPSISGLFESFADLTLCFGFMPNFNITVIGVGWFLGVIFIFYMIFPFFCSFLINTKRRAWITLFISIIYNILCIVYFNQSRKNILFCSMFFVMGGLIYLYKDSITDYISRHKMAALCICIVATAAFIAAKSVYEKLGVLEFISQLIIFTLWFVFLISVDLKISTSKPVKFLAGISMEIFLSQMVIYRVLEKLHLLYFFGKGPAAYIFVVIADMIGTILFSVIVNKIISIISLKIKKASK